MATRSNNATLNQLIRLGGRLRQVRRSRGLSQATLARQLGISVGALRRMEQGRPGVTIGRWAEVLVRLDGPGWVDALLPASGPDPLKVHHCRPRGLRLRSTGPLI